MLINCSVHVQFRISPTVPYHVQLSCKGFTIFQIWNQKLQYVMLHRKTTYICPRWQNNNFIIIINYNYLLWVDKLSYQYMHSTGEQGSYTVVFLPSARHYCTFIINICDRPGQSVGTSHDTTFLMINWLLLSQRHGVARAWISHDLWIQYSYWLLRYEANASLPLIGCTYMCRRRGEGVTWYLLIFQ